MTPSQAETEIVRATIRHYFNAKDECVPGLPYGWDCTLCNSVKALEKLIGEIGLRGMIGQNESRAIVRTELKR